MASPTKYTSFDALGFNPAPSRVMHIDLNSCFASVEQQANPFLRGKPIGVVAYSGPNGVILAPSVEAKMFGVSTGMRLKDARVLCPTILPIACDPNKYRTVHVALRKILNRYTNEFYPKSIDEFVLNLDGYPVLQIKTMHEVGLEIKQRIKMEVGDWLTVSVGLAPNRFLAKTASNLRKPDGLDEINQSNFAQVFARLELTDLSGIKRANAARLASVGVYTVTDFYSASIARLKAAFNSIAGYYWYLRLHGFEVDDFEFGRRTYGNSYSLPKPLASIQELAPVLTKLVEKTTHRMRRAGLAAQGVHLAVSYRNGQFWHKGEKSKETLVTTPEVYRRALLLLTKSPHNSPVRNLAVSCFDLRSVDSTQLALFSDKLREHKVTQSVDALNERWGEYVVTSARMIDTAKFVPDRIAFGNVKELEEFVKVS